MKKWFPAILFFAILAVAIFLRLSLLGAVPAGLTNDEANTGYDAYSILMTGRDQWGQHLPIVFRGFGNYPPPLYRYISIPFLALFGINSFALRLPSALFGILSVFVLFFLIKKLFNQQIGFIAMFLLAVSPWAIGLNRIALEPNLSLFLLLTGLLLSMSSKKKYLLLLLGTLLILLTIPTYAAYTLFAPLIIAGLLFYSLKEKQITKKQTLFTIIFSFLLFLLFYGNSASARFSQVGIFGNITSIGLTNNLNDQRGACLTYLPSIFCKIESNKIVLFSSTLLKNYLEHFSPEFLFISGTSTQQSILPERGLDYLLGVVFFLSGILALLKGNLASKLMLSFLMLSVIPDALTSSGNFSRAFLMLPFLQICEASGAYLVYQQVKKIRLPFIRQVLLWGFVGISIVGIVGFTVTYFTYFRDYYSRFSQYGYEPLMKYVYQEHNKYDRVYITTHFNDAKQYIYYLFYTAYNPKKYQSKRFVDYHEEKDGWVSIDRIDNIYFVSSVPDQQTLTQLTGEGKKVLLISHPSDFPSNLQPQFLVRDRIGYGLFAAENMDTLTKYYMSHPSITPGTQQ